MEYSYNANIWLYFKGWLPTPVKLASPFNLLMYGQSILPDYPVDLSICNPVRTSQVFNMKIISHGHNAGLYLIKYLESINIPKIMFWLPPYFP